MTNAQRPMTKGIMHLPNIPKRAGRRGNPVSAHPLTPDQLVRGIFKIKPADVAKIVASKPGKKAGRLNMRGRRS